MIDMDKELFDEESIEKLRYMAAVSGVPVLQIAEAFEKMFSVLSESLKDIESIFRDIGEMADAPDGDIVTLKKQIKYCKNPMEMKMLNKRLNDAYKKKNGRKYERKHFT